MALGFQNCCDIEEYFYVTGIPGSVSEFETYYIQTVEGDELCGTYVELPTLDYQPITYDLVGMTAQTSCSTCILLNPCPTGITIDFGTQSTGIFSPVNECTIKTIFPFTAECRTIVPIIGQGNANGSVSLFVTGGTPPYNFYSAGTETQIGVGILPTNNEYLLYENVPAGDYSILVHDFWGDNVQVVTCNIPVVPDPLYVECQPNSPEFGLPTSGSLDLLITGGTEPYSIYLSGNPVSLPIFNLSAGTYTLVIEDNGVEDYFQTETVNCILLSPEDIVYPSSLCMNFQYCGVNFYLDFISASTLNYRPVYSATTPSEISVTGMTIFFDDYWQSSVETHNAPLPIPTDCNQSNTVGFTIGNTFSDQPTGSTWISSGTFVDVSPIIVTSGQCSQITPTIIVTTQGGCGLTINDNIGTAVAIANPQSGEPYTYYLDGVESVSNIFNNLGNGGHTVQALDGNGNLSQVIPFTINNLVVSQTNWDYCSYVNTFTNTINGGIKKDNFKARFLNTTSNCSIRAKLRIIYEYAEWSPNNQNTTQTISPYTGTQLLVFLNNVEQTTTTFQLISSQVTPFIIPSCSPTNVYQPFTKTIQVYETTNFINFITLNSLVEVKGVGFAWAWNTTAPLISYPQCYPAVSGTSTVQIFNANLSFPPNCQCILPPQDVTIGVSQINVNRRNTTLVGNVILNTPANIPANMNCTV